MREDKWIDFLKERFYGCKSVLLGIGDDAAVVKIGNKNCIIGGDLFIEGVHFKRNDMTFEDIGFRAAARALSDIVACGGKPRFMGVSVSIDYRTSTSVLKKIFVGIDKICRKYNICLIGGDTARSNILCIDVWIIGEGEKYVSRRGAKLGDYIFLSDRLGVLEFNEVFYPPVSKIHKLVNNYRINAMIDVSDGFIIDLARLLKASGKGALLFYEQIPFQKISDLSRGEDYVFIFTVDKHERKISLLKNKFFLVGTVREKDYGLKWIKKNRITKVPVKGYTHF